MSKSLIRLVDEAILPAFLIVGLKVIGIAAVNNLLSLSFYYQNFGKIYYQQSFDALKVNTYSDIIVYLFFLFAIIFLLFKLLYFSDNKVTPSMLLRLAKAKKVGFVQTSIEIYHTIFVWMFYFTGITIYILIRAFQYIDYSTLIIPLCIICLTIFWILFREVEKDIFKKLEQGKNTLV